MNARISPCKDCESRKVGCHAGCESYLTWRADLDYTIAEKARQAEINSWTTTRAKTTDEWFRSRGDWWKK